MSDPAYSRVLRLASTHANHAMYMIVHDLYVYICRCLHVHDCRDSRVLRFSREPCDRWPVPVARCPKARDTGDVGVYLSKWVQKSGALHCVLKEEQAHDESDYFNFMFRMFVLRRYRLEVWQRLVPAIPPAGTPAWPLVLCVFAGAYRAKEKVCPHCKEKSMMSNLTPVHRMF